MGTKTTKKHRSATAKRKWTSGPATSEHGDPRPKQRPTPPARRRPSGRRRGEGPSWGLLAVIAGVGLVLFFYFGSRSARPSGGTVAARRAPTFTLASTTGGNVSLSDYAGKKVLLYFSEGIGCDACFYQMVDLEKNAKQLSDAGITVLPIVMNPVDQVRSEEQRFGLSTPFLVDADGSVSKAYGVLCKGMHANLPGHSFVLIDGLGRIRFQKEYPSMYVSTADLLSSLRPVLS